MSICCNPKSIPIEYPIIDSYFPEINLNKCFCQDWEEICKLKQKIICEFWKVLHGLNCGIQPDLQFLLQEISYLYAISDKGMGVEISKNIQQEYNRHDLFYIGAGYSYEDIINDKYLKRLDTTSYDVTFSQNSRLFIILPNNLEIVRADMNGFEIPFNIQTTDKYKIYTSKNLYNKGTYNIDITI